jgi:hypothetical protein
MQRQIKPIHYLIRCDVSSWHINQRLKDYARSIIVGEGNLIGRLAYRVIVGKYRPATNQ